MAMPKFPATASTGAAWTSTPAAPNNNNHSGDDSGDRGVLDPCSYTGHRLHHATPQHLHLTSRRVFVGPLPTGWIKHHRKDWYRQHLHYTKRQSTFSAQPNTIPKRAVTGLEFPPGNAHDDGNHDDDDMRPHSLPIPIPPSFGRSHSSSTYTIRPTIQQLTAPAADESRLTPPTPTQLRPETADTTASLATARSRPKTTESLFQPSWLHRGESFATANETWDHQAQSGEAEELSPIPAVYGEQSSISATNSTRAHDSLVSLLKRDRDRRQSHHSADSHPMNLDGYSGNVHFVEPSGLPSILSRKSNIETKPLEELDPTPWSQPPSRVSTSQDRVAGGLVRFNAEDTAIQDKNRQVVQKAAGLSRARSLRLGARRWLSLRRRDGEILKMESMLVRIEAAHAQQLPDNYDENESLKVTTRVAEKWREYVVVCRESDNPDIPMLLRLYKSKSIPTVDKRLSFRSIFEVPLNSKTTRANLYSSLDKTLVIWLPYKRGTLIYIMRPRCASSSVDWYAFLRAALGEPPCHSLQLSVPDLTLTITIKNPFDRPEHTERNEQGNIIAIEQKAVAGTILRKSMAMLENVDEWEDLLTHWQRHEKMGLAWRRYDRLEWVHGTNEERMDGSIAMQKTHELELRPKTHYPTESVLENGEKMTEPPPVEGFLVRMTSEKGRGERLGRMFQKRLYWATHDQFLCYCRPSRALPPPPPRSLGRDGVVPTADEVESGMPLIFGVTPFALDKNGQIEWLADPVPGRVQRKDEEAYLEAQRKINLLQRAEGFVDLTKATQVRRVAVAAAAAATTTAALDRAAAAEESDGGGSGVEADDDVCFEILLNNGLALKLQAFDAQTRDEWILRLTELATYWKARDRGDLASVRGIRDVNLRQLGMDEEMESVMGQFGRKWEVTRTVASGELFHVCGLSSCRTIVMSGTLYRKPRRHATFRRYNVLLVTGELLIFQHTFRGRTGREVACTTYEKHVALPLRDCYLYSGLLTTADLLYQNRTFDSNTPGRHALPRIYADGYTSRDEDEMTCFVLWRGVGERGGGGWAGIRGRGGEGRAVVFRARSRVERDAWVMAIAVEIERANVGREEGGKVVG